MALWVANISDPVLDAANINYSGVYWLCFQEQ